MYELDKKQPEWVAAIILEVKIRLKAGFQFPATRQRGGRSFGFIFFYNWWQ